MKRSRSIRLVLIGGLSAGALTSCGPSDIRSTPISANNVYTNNYYVPGVGYYHAPFRAWYPLPYNHFDPKSQRYFYGGEWAATPSQNITNISAPTPDAAQWAEHQRNDVARSGTVSRGGFGRSSGYHHTYS